MAGPWMKALDAQLDLLRLWKSPLAWGAARGAIEYLGWPEEACDQYGAAMADSFDRAGTYWVSEEMGRFLAYAQQDYPAKPLGWGDDPEVNGFVYFERAMGFDDIGGRPKGAAPGALDIHALHWCWLGDGDVLESSTLLVELYVHTGPNLSPIAHCAINIGQPPLDTIGRLVLSFWALSQQRIAQPERGAVDRPGRRRAARAGFVIPEDGVRVVTLRRPETRTTISDDSGLVEWSHRWIVSGHWRNQWYPATDQHRPRWIAPYEKGPEGKPLVLKDRVYRWVR